MGAIWRVPPEVVRTGTQFFDQQCWCWGQDVLHPDGNGLVRRGFTREPSNETDVPSRYAKDGFVLWAFGIFCGVDDLGGMLLARKDFRARLTPDVSPPPIWTVRDAVVRFPTTPEEGETLRTLLHRTLLFLADDEDAAQTTLGLTWRKATLAHRKPKPVAANQMPDEWRRLAALLR